MVCRRMRLCVTQNWRFYIPAACIAGRFIGRLLSCIEGRSWLRIGAAERSRVDVVASWGAALRSPTPRSQDESPCRAIHKQRPHRQINLPTMFMDGGHGVPCPYDLRGARMKNMYAASRIAKTAEIMAPAMRSHVLVNCTST